MSVPWSQTITFKRVGILLVSSLTSHQIGLSGGVNGSSAAKQATQKNADSSVCGQTGCIKGQFLVAEVCFYKRLGNWEQAGLFLLFVWQHLSSLCGISSIPATVGIKVSN